MTSTSKAFNIRAAQWKKGETFSDYLYLDANPVLDIVLERPYGNLYNDYLKEVVNRGGMVIWSTHTYNEVLDTIHHSKYFEYAKENGFVGNSIKEAWKFVEDQLTTTESCRIAENVLEETNKIFKSLEQYGVSVDNEDTNEVQEITKYLYLTCGGGRKDAMHVAIANLNGSNSILSNDPGLLRYPSLNVFGASSTLIANVTPNQAHVDYYQFSEFVNSSKEGIIT